MTGTVEALEQLRSSLLDVLRFDEPAAWSDHELLAATTSIEAVGRVVDAHRAACAAEVAERSKVELGDARLSTRRSCRSASELLERVTEASGAEVRRRIVLGSATRPQMGFSGEPVEAHFPAVAAALADGDLGADAAWSIVRELDRARRVADPIAFAAADRELVDAATGVGDAAPIRASPMSFGCRRRPGQRSSTKTGPSPTTSGRCVDAGSGSAGLIPVSGELLPEVAARLTRLFHAHLAPRSGGGFMTEAERADIARRGETRTADQQRHDILATIIQSSARSGEHPSIGGAAPTVLVSVRASDLKAGRGVGHADGVDVPVSLRAVRQLICTGGIQKVGFDDHGRIIGIGSPERCFTPHQRRAITLRDGAASSPAAACRRLGARSTTSSPTSTAALPTPTTEYCSAGFTTTPSKPPVGASGCTVASRRSRRRHGSTPAAAGGPPRNPRPASPTNSTEDQTQQRDERRRPE
jgi:hypothetical protein